MNPKLNMDATFWNDRYAVADHVYGEEPNAFVAEVAPHIPAGPVLCLAEGEGRNAVHLAASGHLVTAVDQSEVGLAKARCLAAAHGVEITTVTADLGGYDIAVGAWAGIIAIRFGILMRANVNSNFLEVNGSSDLFTISDGKLSNIEHKIRNKTIFIDIVIHNELYYLSFVLARHLLMILAHATRSLSDPRLGFHVHRHPKSKFLAVKQNEK